MTAELGKVASLWRYPVKSMQGEELSEAGRSGLRAGRCGRRQDRVCKEPGQMADALRLQGGLRRATEKWRRAPGRPHCVARWFQHGKHRTRLSSDSLKGVEADGH